MDAVLVLERPRECTRRSCCEDDPRPRGGGASNDEDGGEIDALLRGTGTGAWLAADVGLGDGAEGSEVTFVSDVEGEMMAGEGVLDLDCDLDLERSSPSSPLPLLNEPRPLALSEAPDAILLLLPILPDDVLRKGKSSKSGPSKER